MDRHWKYLKPYIFALFTLHFYFSIAENLKYKRDHGKLGDWKVGFDKPFLQGFKGQPIPLSAGPGPTVPPDGPRLMFCVKARANIL